MHNLGRVPGLTHIAVHRDIAATRFLMPCCEYTINPGYTYSLHHTLVNTKNTPPNTQTNY